MHEMGDSLAHLFCRFVGEGDSEDVPRGHATVNEVYDTVRNDTGFARTCSRENHQRPFSMGDRCALLFIESFKVRNGFVHVGTLYPTLTFLSLLFF